MSSVQVAVAGPGVQESGIAALSRWNSNSAGLAKSSSTSFKERLNQASRKMDNASAGERQEAAPANEVSGQENAAPSEDKSTASVENQTSGKDAVAAEGKKDQKSENTSPLNQDGSPDTVNGQADVVLLPAGVLGIVVTNQDQNPAQPIIESATGSESPATALPVESGVNTVLTTASELLNPNANMGDGGAAPGDSEIQDQTVSDDTILAQPGSDKIKDATTKVVQAGVGNTQEDPASSQKPLMPEQNKSEIRKVLDMEGQRSSINRLNVQQAETAADTGSDAQTESDNGQTSTPFNLTEVSITKMSNREIIPADISKAQAAVDSQDLMNQVVQKADLMLKQNSSEMTIQLKPGFLGKMTIKILVDDAGTVTAHFTTSSQQVKNMLEQNLQTLRQNLEAQGMKVDRAEVNVQLDSGGMLGDFGGRQQELWQQFNARNFSGSNRSYNSQTLESVLSNESSIYPMSYGSLQDDDGFNFLV